MKVFVLDKVGTLCVSSKLETAVFVCQSNIGWHFSNLITKVYLNPFSCYFQKSIRKFITGVYDPIILQRTACLVFNPFTVGNIAFLFD